MKYDKVLQQIPPYLKWGFYFEKQAMNLFSAKSYIFKKTRPFIVVLIVSSLLHNFIVFPVQAAMDTSSETPIVNQGLSIIKKPETSIKRMERLSKVDTTDRTIDFTLIPEEKAKETEVAKPVPSTPISSRRVSMTAYNSEAAQTDGDPCTTANGFNVCKHGIEDTVASNFLPMGTKIKIPSLFGDRIFVVRDRMNRRYTNRVDVWMLKKSDALKFGVRQAEIVVVK